MYIFIYSQAYIYIYIHTCLNTNIYIYIYIHLYTSKYVFMYVCVYNQHAAAAVPSLLLSKVLFLGYSLCCRLVCVVFVHVDCVLHVCHDIHDPKQLDDLFGIVHLKGREVLDGRFCGFQVLCWDLFSSFHSTYIITLVI